MALPRRVLVVSMLARIVSAASVCYDTSGNVKDNFVPCDTSADVSVCCTANDYCLDNGLCLDAGGDNQFTVQGCTNSDWSSPCVQYCPDMGTTTNWYQVLTLCSTRDRVSGRYCCGENATCCETTSSVSITLPIFTNVFKPGSASSQATTTGSTSSLSDSTATGTGAVAAIGSQNPNPSENSDKSLAIGLGVGIPLGLVLVGAIGFLGWQMRRQNNLRQQDTAQKSTSGSKGFYTQAVETQETQWPQELHEDATRGELQADPRLHKWELPADGS
ncbi:hypothetical protein F5X99DRAFT_152891 [Biscogniauxia marginata]|nr:hypothetical protein F5X99DRAFT_152891 [Biscogniauxia marginata]